VGGVSGESVAEELPMQIDGIIWLEEVVDKLIFKHNVETHEIEEVFGDAPKFRFTTTSFQFAR
jgi:hypothetical protein